MIKFLFSFLIFYLLIDNSYSQKTNYDSLPKQNRIAIGFGFKQMSIDSTTTLDSLIGRLNGNWHYNETEQLHLIGYTNDMFSIAARGDVAIQLLLNLIDTSSNQHSIDGAVFTLYLIGIDRRVAGKFKKDVFVNTKARQALLYLLKYPDLQPLIMCLLLRDPSKSDSEAILETLKTCKSDCWSLCNGLLRYNLKNPPISQPIPDTFSKISIKISQPMFHQSNKSFVDEEDDLIKEALDSLRKLKTSLIVIEDTLFKSSFMYSEGLNYTFYGDMTAEYIATEVTRSGWDEIGRKIQYYIENRKLYFCSPSTAKKRWLAWWSKQNSGSR